MQTLEIDDAIVLLLGVPANDPSLRDQIKGITRLEKLVFLIERETALKDLLKEDARFRPYNFGPFSENVYRSVGYLSSYGLLEDTGRISDNTEDAWEQIQAIGIDQIDPYLTRDFRLTDIGKRYYESLIQDIPEHYIQDLSQFKERFAPIPLRQLVRYVYLRYPDMTERSLIREDILNDG